MFIFYTPWSKNVVETVVDIAYIYKRKCKRNARNHILHWIIIAYKTISPENRRIDFTY